MSVSRHAAYSLLICFAQSVSATVISVVMLLTSTAYASDLQDALVVSNSAVLRSLEDKGFSLGDLISQQSGVGILSNAQLATRPQIQPVIENIKAEVAAFKTKNPASGVGIGYSQRLFDVNYLTNPSARFALVGIINRMDQGFKDPDHCGELRFIYRLAYSVQDKGAPVSSRLPMTINLIFNAGKPGQCVDVAKAWLNVNAQSTADDLLKTGPLQSSLFDRKGARRLEINLQIVRWPAAVAPDFGGHAEYLLKVYGWTGTDFRETYLENEIDRDRLLASPALMKEFKAWILDPSRLKDIDRGTHLIPEKFLAKSGLSIAPGGINRSANRLFYTLMSADDLAHLSFTGLEQIKSQIGFLRRLNDSTCIGCHQSRAIGGFHFTGRDPLGRYPGNSVYLPGSAHFMGDLPRRKSILNQIINQPSSGETIDYSRGFSERPQERRSKEILGSGLLNGWGAHCIAGHDASFNSWTCADSLICQPLMDKQDGLEAGICLTKNPQEVGNPCETGRIDTASFGHDKYTRTALLLHFNDPNKMCSPQSQEAGTKTGGFLDGNVRTLTCDNLPSEAICAPLPAARPGFNACIGQKNFIQCLKDFSTGVGLRSCDQMNPCRDDYICSESYDSGHGACVPPYFLFQFRVDGHPAGTQQLASH